LKGGIQITPNKHTGTPCFEAVVGERELERALEAVVGERELEEFLSQNGSRAPPKQIKRERGVEASCSPYHSCTSPARRCRSVTGGHFASSPLFQDPVLLARAYGRRPVAFFPRSAAAAAAASSSPAPTAESSSRAHGRVLLPRSPPLGRPPPGSRLLPAGLEGDDRGITVFSRGP